MRSKWFVKSFYHPAFKGLEYHKSRTHVIQAFSLRYLHKKHEPKGLLDIFILNTAYQPINPILHGLLEIRYHMGGGSKRSPPIKIYQIK